MKVYNSIPTELKPPPGADQLLYDDYFDNEFSLLLRERRPNTLDAMMSDAIEFKVNLMASGKIKHNLTEMSRRSKEKRNPQLLNHQLRNLI